MPDIDNTIAFLHRLIGVIEQCTPADAQQQRLNASTISTYRDEIVELEDLRDGHLTVDQLGTARRFFNQMPAWATYGT